MSPLAPQTLAYLATPYTKYALGLDAAHAAAERLAALLLRTSIVVYSPITYTHPIARARRLDPLDLALWLPLEERMCAACDVLLVAHLAGWRESDGIAREVERFADAGKPIYDLDPATLRMTRRRDPREPHASLFRSESAGAPA